MNNVKRLIKGLVAGESTAPLVAGQGGVAGDLSALKPHTIMEYIADFSQDWTLFRFYQTLPKKEQESNIFTYRQKVSRTNLQATGFVKEAERGVVTDSTYTSKSQTMAYIRIIRKITDVAEKIYVKNMNPTALQIDDAVKEVITVANKGLIFGDSTVNPDSMDGVLKLQKDWFGTIDAWYKSAFVRDLRGEVIEVPDVNNGCRVVQNQGFGVARDMYVSTNIQAVLENKFYEKGITRNHDLSGQEVIEGVSITKIKAGSGVVSLQPELALSFEDGISQLTPTTGGDAPFSVTITAVPETSSLTLFDAKANGSANGHGDYLYAVRPLNRFGLGAMSNVVAVTVGAGESVKIAVSDLNLSNEATGYVVYRSKADLTSASDLVYPIFEIGRAVVDISGYDGAPVGFAYDHNRYLPQTEKAFLVQSDAETWEEHCLKDYDMNVEFYAKTSPSREVCVSRSDNATLYFPYRMITYLNCGGVVLED